MPKYVAFLRAINVGGHTVKMDYLRLLFGTLGFSNIETFIASGNVIFDSKSEDTRALEQKIAGCLQAALGYRVATFIRSTLELGAIADYKPFKEADLNAAGNTLYIGFFADGPDDKAREKLPTFTTAVDVFHLAGREVYWLRRSGTTESEFSGARLEKAFGMEATLRNSTTVRKIAAKYK